MGGDKMEWDKLLTPYRLGCPKELEPPDPNRNEFQRDYDKQEEH